MDLGLKDKRALIAGSSSGLGYALGLALAQEGCLVTLNGRDEGRLAAAVSKLSGEAGQKASGFPGFMRTVQKPISPCFARISLTIS